MAGHTAAAPPLGANLALRLAKAGADGLVLFNRCDQPDLDPESRRINLELVLSQSHEMRLPLRWVALLYGRVPVDLAITSGVHSTRDVVKGPMAGAKVTTMASELLQRGVGRIGEVTEELGHWLEAQGYASVAEIQGAMRQVNAAHPEVFERANYIKMLRKP